MTSLEERIKNYPSLLFSEDELQEIKKFQKTFGINDNDAIFDILIALQYHLALYKEIPSAINQTIARSMSNSLDKFDKSYKNLTEAAVQSYKSDLNKTVNETLISSARKMSFWHIALTFIIFIAVVVGGFYFLKDQYFNEGYTAGKAEGYSLASDEKARFVWANTEQGKLAYQIALNGDIDYAFYLSKNKQIKTAFQISTASSSSLNHFLECDLPGWKISTDKFGNKGCYPYDKNDTLHGWPIP